MNILPMVKGFLKSGLNLAEKHLPGILMGMGTGCVTGSVILAISNGQKATILIEEAEREKAKAINQENGDRKIFLAELTPKEKVKAVWKVYITPFGLLLVGIGCFWTGHVVDLKRQALLAGLYSTAEASLAEYQRKINELLGKDGQDIVRQSIAQDHVNRQPNPQNITVLSGDTDEWCEICGRRFRSSYVKIKNAENEVNHRMISEMYISRAELFWALDPAGYYLHPGPEDQQVYYDLDRLIELKVEPIITDDFKAVLHVSILDKDGLDYLPRAKFGMLNS